MQNFKVALDGPAGSGKSSISEIIANKLGFVHIDTGAMYRAVTLKALEDGIDLADESKYDFLDHIDLIYMNDKTFLEGKDVSDLIRTDEVTRNVSLVSSLKRVRDKMLIFQRRSAKIGYILMDGRDIGTVVLPDADVKIFLTASPEERAKRRLKEMQEKGMETTYDVVLKDIIERDYKDSHRAIAPLVKPEDAILVDTTKMSIDEVCNTIISIITERMSKMEKQETMSDLFDEMPELKLHQIVKGEVIKVDHKSASINLNSFTEGKIYLDHYTLDKNATDLREYLHVGDILEAEITKIDQDGDSSEILLSRLNLEKNKYFEEFKEEAKAGTLNVVGRVVKIIPNKGYVLDYKGISCFMPIKDVKEELHVGDKIEVRVLNVDETRKNAFVSHFVIEREKRQKEHEEYVLKKQQEHEEYLRMREEELQKLHVGDVVKGVVSNIVPYGAFVRLDKVQGLIRLKEVDHDFIKSASERISVGEEVTCKVISLDNGKLELSRKALIESPFEAFVKNHNVGDKISARVVNKMPFGVLCEVAPKVTGLLHKSEFSWNPNDNLMASLLIGDEVEVAILNIDKDKEKIGLSKKALIDNPWSRVTCKVGDDATGEITEVSSKGLKVSVFGVDGFIPQRFVVTDAKSSKLEDYYAVGDKISAKVYEVNTKQWILNLNQKAYEEEVSRKQYEEYMEKEEENKKTTLGDIFQDELKK